MQSRWPHNTRAQSVPHGKSAARVSFASKSRSTLNTTGRIMMAQRRSSPGTTVQNTSKPSLANSVQHGSPLAETTLENRTWPANLAFISSGSCEYDVVIIGKIFTGRKEVQLWAECLAFNRKSGLIVFVGTEQELSEKTDEGILQRHAHCHTRVANGLVLPGFHDAHCHPFGAGNRMRQSREHDVKADEKLRQGALDLSACDNWKDVARCIKHAASSRKDGEAIVAEGCSPYVFVSREEDDANPIDILETLAPGKSLVILIGEASEEKEVLASETAINALPRLCKLWEFRDDDTTVERDPDGRKNGRFLGEVWVARFALLSSASMASKGLRGLLDGLAMLPQHGIVSCIDAFVFENRVPSYELAFEQDTAHILPRIGLALGLKAYWGDEQLSGALDRMVKIRRDWAETHNRYCIREAKVEVDNVCQWSSTYRGSTACWDLEKLDRVIDAMVNADFSMHFHVFGDLAAKHALQALQRAELLALKHDPGSSQNRIHKLAHLFELQLVDENAMPANVKAVYQPAWFSDKEWSSYDNEAVQTHQRLSARGLVCYGSDWDISSLSPLNGIADALSRDGAFAGSWKECLANAIRLQTFEAAHAMRLDSISGTLEVGKMADICILDKDIFLDNAGKKSSNDWSIAPELGAHVEATISAGVLLYQRDVAACVLTESSVPEPPVATCVTRRSRGSLPLKKTSEDSKLVATCGCLDAKCVWAGLSRRNSTKQLCTPAFRSK